MPTENTLNTMELTLLQFQYLFIRANQRTYHISVSIVNTGENWSHSCIRKQTQRLQVMTLHRYNVTGHV